MCCLGGGVGRAGRGGGVLATGAGAVVVPLLVVVVVAPVAPFVDRGGGNLGGALGPDAVVALG